MREKADERDQQKYINGYKKMERGRTPGHYIVKQMEMPPKWSKAKLLRKPFTNLCMMNNFSVKHIHTSQYTDTHSHTYVFTHCYYYYYYIFATCESYIESVRTRHSHTANLT